MRNLISTREALRARLAAAAALSFGCCLALPAPAAISDATRQDALASIGQTSSRHAPLSPVTPPHEESTGNARSQAWDVRADDQNLDRLLQRWGESAHWRVIWDDAPPVPLAGSGQLPASSFLQAAQYVVAHARQAGFAIAATAYADKTLVITGAVAVSTPVPTHPSSAESGQTTGALSLFDQPPQAVAAKPKNEPATAVGTAATPPAVPPTTPTATAKLAPAPGPAVIAPPRPAQPIAGMWTMKKGQPVHLALTDWAKKAGWELIWYPGVSWLAIADVDMGVQPDVVAAVSEVINVLRDEGKPVQLRISDGNHVMEVLSTEIKND